MAQIINRFQGETRPLSIVHVSPHFSIACDVSQPEFGAGNRRPPRILYHPLDKWRTRSPWVGLFHFQINTEIIRPLGGRGTSPADTRMIVQTPLGEAGALPSQRPDGA
jgi:hypothetical protein